MPKKKVEKTPEEKEASKFEIRRQNRESQKRKRNRIMEIIEEHKVQINWTTQ